MRLTTVSWELYSSSIVTVRSGNIESVFNVYNDVRQPKYRKREIEKEERNFIDVDVDRDTYSVEYGCVML